MTKKKQNGQLNLEPENFTQTRALSLIPQSNDTLLLNSELNNRSLDIVNISSQYRKWNVVNTHLIHIFEFWKIYFIVLCIKSYNIHNKKIIKVEKIRFYKWTNPMIAVFCNLLFCYLWTVEYNPSFKVE